MGSNKPVPDSVEDVAEAFNRDGFLIATGLYCPEEMLDWKARIIYILEAGGHISKDPTSAGVHVFMSDVLDPFFRERMKDACVVSVLNRIIGPNVEFLSVKSVYKNKFTRFGSPWHQDWYYWKGANKISVWIALDDATPENGCLKMIAGSHLKRFKVKQVRAQNGFGWRIGNEEIAGLPETTLAVRRGDAVFFHDQTLHSSFPNTTGADRWSFISTYRDGSVMDESTVWKHPMVVTGESLNVG
ncbi:MAG: phytanoyl-CoA dioxygenase family protein [Gemmatimonadetes bacterium]|nr:phytanoyl-CoA dioxygenase family protein [Gemmatimonadota bacterium]